MSADNFSLRLILENEVQTDRLGEDLALALRPGDLLALSGELGAGKSSLARAFIRAVAQDDDLEVPSPTFTLVQTYDLRMPVSHFDLYRLSDPSELAELGFDEAVETGICLVEWPEMGGDALNGQGIFLRLEHEGKGRRAEISTTSAAQFNRIRRSLAIRSFLHKAGYPAARRYFLTGDASLRAYEAVYPQNSERLILMDWPPLPEGPAVLDGKPYPKVAHLAENAYPYVAIAQELLARGFTAPAVYEVDYEQGILLVQDLGGVGVLDEAGKPIAERYRTAVACLGSLHAQRFPNEIVVGDHLHLVPDFDRTAMKMEVRLLLDWYLPWIRQGQPASDTERAEYLAIWDALIDRLEAAEKNLLLRDFHSPNILWQKDRKGIARIGLIDFQDAMIGPTSYDLASIVQDARVTIDVELRAELMEEYLLLRRRHDGFDETAFLESWSIMAAQRNCKLVGIWVRLAQRDKKVGYLSHMPRTLSYLRYTLDHPTLAPLRNWCIQAGVDVNDG